MDRRNRTVNNWPLYEIHQESHVVALVLDELVLVRTSTLVDAITGYLASCSVEILTIGEGARP
jgi:hypothetical protein